MPGKPVFSSQLWVPLSAVTAVIGITVASMGWLNAHTTDTALLKNDVANLTERVNKAEARLDKSDARWDQIRDDLAAIKERLGIVEAKSPGEKNANRAKN